MTVLIGPLDRTESYSVALANTNTTACYTNVGKRASKGVAVHIGNENGSTVVALIYRYDFSTTTEFCLGGLSIADDRGDTYDLRGMRLDVSDEIRVKADNLVDVTVTVLEFQGPG